MDKSTSFSSLDFEQILENNKSKIYRICTIYAVPPLEPQDLFQEVVFQVWKSWPSFNGKSAIGTWIYKIALNVCLRTKLRSDKRNQKEVRLPSIEVLPQAKGSESSDYQQLRHCIASLNQSDQSLVVLFLEDLAYREIAEVLGISENHVAVKMKRVRQKLFNCIEPKK